MPMETFNLSGFSSAFIPPGCDGETSLPGDPDSFQSQIKCKQQGCVEEAGGHDTGHK